MVAPALQPRERQERRSPDGHKGPATLNITYNHKRTPGENHLVNGATESKLSISPINPPNVTPPSRIVIVLTFKYENSGPLTFPRTASVRLIYNRTKQIYEFTEHDMKTIAADFVNVMDEVGGGRFDAKNTIQNTDVTITIHNDAGGLLETLEGWLTISPSLINSRD